MKRKIENKKTNKIIRRLVMLHDGFKQQKRESVSRSRTAEAVISGN